MPCHLDIERINKIILIKKNQIHTAEIDPLKSFQPIVQINNSYLFYGIFAGSPDRKTIHMSRL